MNKFTIKALRINKGISLEEASIKLSITKKTLIDYEKGSTVPNFLMILKMCELYGCDIEQIDAKIFESNITK